jgi:FdrA protein
MGQALRMIASDDSTEVVVLVSKPPHPSVLPGILDAARVVTSTGKHVVAVFVGLAGPTVASQDPYVHMVSTLAAAAERAVSLLGVTASSTEGSSTERSSTVESSTAATGAEGLSTEPSTPGPVASDRRGRVRGGFVGGTFRHEAGVLLDAKGLRGRSDLIDFGDDDYTAGRPHPMIEPSMRDRWIGDALADPETAAVLFDVVLGLGAHFDPLITMRVQLAAPTRRPDVVVVAHVCGTDLDPQNRGAVSAELAASGVLVAGSNAQAVEWVARVCGAAK